MSDREQGNFDPLDEVLGAARWEGLSGEAEGRLRKSWEGLRGRRMVTWWWGVAAVLMVGIGVGLVVMKEERPRARGLARKEVAVIASVPSREANVAELAVALGGMRGEGIGPAAVKVRRGEEALEALLRRDVGAGVGRCLAMAGREREGEAVAALKVVRGAAVERLFSRLDDPVVGVRQAAARLLGKVDGPAVTARLAGMVGENRNRAEALAALMQSDGAEARQYMEQLQGRKDLRGLVRSVAVQIRNF